jgi:hypothetical protein
LPCLSKCKSCENDYECLECLDESGVSQNSVDCSCNIGGVVQANQSDIEYSLYGWAKLSDSPTIYLDKFATIARVSDYGNLDGITNNIGARTLAILQNLEKIQYAGYDLNEPNWSRQTDFQSSYIVLQEWCFFYIGYSHF